MYIGRGHSTIVNYLSFIYNKRGSLGGRGMWRLKTKCMVGTRGAYLTGTHSLEESQTMT